jgi:predicted Ser/Thr protein kinase
MAYPSIEQYQRALQNPQYVFTDAQLKGGKIRSSGLGLPLVASGGFALTYALESGGRKFAVRCFHREAPGIERRYAAISSKVKGLSSKYFVDFDFQPRGAQIDKGYYPLVKMAWAEGETLGEFVETNFQDKAKLTNLIASLTELSRYLESVGIAHGDIQEGNLMVADGGRKVQLIDYDGMYVPEVAVLGGSELGHRDYQHPKRSMENFGARIDRFSFISLNLALRAICLRPSMWNASQSGAGVILFRANDFAAPGQSMVLQEIAKIPGLERDAKSLMAICAAEFSAIPSLTDFFNGLNIPAVAIRQIAVGVVQRAGYISQYPVLNGAGYDVFNANIGSMVELVGKVIEVRVARDKYGKPYIFINFAHWQGKTVKIALWSKALKGSKELPSATWVGQWVTIRGLVEPVYSNKKLGYDHITITAPLVSHISKLTEQEARYRLTPGSSQQASGQSLSSNAAALAALNNAGSGSANGMGGGQRQQGRAPVPAAQPQSLTANQLALQKLRQQAPQATGQSGGANSGGSASANGVGTRQSSNAAGRVGSSSNYSQNNANPGPRKKGFLDWLVSIFS